MTIFAGNSKLATFGRDAIKPQIAKILVVDDDVMVLNALCETLRRNGHEVLQATSGDEALKILEREAVALIICDQRMPNMSGLELLQHAQKICPDAVRVALTGNNEREIVINAINIGQVSQFISKPWEDIVLEQVVSSSLDKYRLAKENKDLHSLILMQNKELDKANKNLRYELQLGARIHEELLLGKVPKNVPGIEIAATTVPTKEIDGDFYDFYTPLSHIVDVVIGDVMGKGMPAALVGTAIKAQLQRFAVPLSHVKYCDRTAFWLDDLFSTSTILKHTHDEIAKELMELEFFVSLLYGRFDLEKRVFTFVDCGSTKPLHYKSKNVSIRYLRGNDFPVGMVAKNDYHEFEAAFEVDDLFVFYSDGITECRAPSGEIYGCEKLEEMVRKHAHNDAETLLNAIRADVLEHAQTEHFEDDLTLLVIKITPHDDFKVNKSLSASYLNDLSQLNAVRSFVKRVCDNAPGNPDALHNALELAIDEAFCNIVKHAYKGETGQTIYLKAQYHDEGLWLELSDKGSNFNPKIIPEPSLIGDEESGYGLFLIRQLADQLAYIPKSDPDGWNHLRIYKRYIFKEVPMEFSHTTQDNILVVMPTGPSLDAREARDFKDRVVSLINESNSHSIVIDMRNLQFIDSSGLGTFLSILKTLHVQGGELKLANLNKPIRTIFELVSMHKIFEIYNTTEEAVLSFK